MSNIHQAETVAVKACPACGGGLLDYDRFCRWCGTRQPDSPMPGGDATDGAASSCQRSAQLSYVTAALEGAGAEAALYRRISGPLVNAVVTTVSANSSRRPRNRALKKTVLALVSLPLWLMIVLLSPLDAYAAAKSLSEEM
jgi:hypothetical protein